MIAYKVKFKNYIANLYLPKPEIISNKIVLLIPGLPEASNKDKIVGAFLDAGCFVLCPQLAGSYDSGGDYNPFKHIKEINTFIYFVKKEKMKELYYNKIITLGKNNKIILVGTSYGAIISLLGRTNKIGKMILLSPVLLLNQKNISKIINFDFNSQMKSLVLLLKNHLHFSYRASSYNKLKEFLFGSNKILQRKEIEKCLNKINIPTLIIHGLNDKSVPIEISKSLKNSTHNKNINWYFPKAGHSTSSYSNKVLKIIKDFI